MATTLFFSWQADHPSRTGRNLIQKALERAIGTLKADIEVDDAVRGDLAIDHDTLDVPGTPAIVDTILRKIDDASIFLPDFTFVGKRPDDRPMPNPNVLIEYGYALKTLGHGRMIPVMNTAYGKPGHATLPFDMIHLRHPITYHCPADADEAARRAARIELEGKLIRAIKTVLNSEGFKTALPQPPRPPAFPRRQPKDGTARFRAAGEPLGSVHEPGRLERPISDVCLAAGSPTWLRLMPTVDPARRWKWAELKQAGRAAVPIHWPGGSIIELRAEDGFALAALAGLDGVAEGVTTVFDTGEIWSVDTRVIDAVRDRHLPLNEPGFIEALGRFTKVARRLGNEGPFRWIAGMSGVKGRRLTTAEGNGLAGASVADEIVAEGDHDHDADPAVSLEPFFELAFDRCGMDRAEWVAKRNALPPRRGVTITMVNDDP